MTTTPDTPRGEPVDNVDNVTPIRPRAEVPEVAGDYLNAQRFLAEYGDKIRRSPELGRWYVWNGAWWCEDRTERVARFAADTIEHLRGWVAEAPNADEFRRRSRHYEASAKSGRRDGLLSLVGTHGAVVVAVEQLDTHPLLLACRNGTVDLTNGSLGPPDPARLITRGIDVDYDPDAFSEAWVAFLDRIFDADVDLIAFVQRLLGYCITGLVYEHVLPVLSGIGANGKSTLIGVVQDLLGEHAITAPEGLIIRRDHEPHPERLAALRGKRLVVSAELEHRAVLAEAIVKVLTGGDTLSARELYGRRFNFKPSHKVLLVTNVQPRVYGTDHAIWRRLKVVPFKTVIPVDEQDPTLRRRLVEDHGPAVLAWLVRGAIDWNRYGLGEAPSAVTEATEEYRTSEDTFGAWRDECTVAVEQTVRTKVGELFDAWRGWCETTGERPGRRQDFVRALEEHGVKVEQYGHNSLTRGIGLVVRTGEHSSRNSSISPPRGTLRGSPHESSKELFGGAK
jgi:putative DNA primase/helicase